VSTSSAPRDVHPAPLFTRPFVLCALSNLLQGISFALFLHLPGYLSELGADAAQVGWIYGLTFLLAIVVRPGLGVVMDTRGRRDVIVAGNLLNMAVIGLYFSVDAIGPWVYVVRALHGVSEAMLFTSLFTYAADHVPPSRLTEGLALFGVSSMLPMSLGGALGDWVIPRIGYGGLFEVALAFAVAAGALALPLRDERRHGASEDERPHGFLAALGQRDLLPLWWIATVFATGLAAVWTFLKLFVMQAEAGSLGEFATCYTAVAIALRIFLGWLPDRVGPKLVLFPALLCFAAGFFVLATASGSGGVAIAGLLIGIGHGDCVPTVFGMVVRRARAADRGSALAIYTGLFDVGGLLGGPPLGYLIDGLGFGAMYATTGAAIVLGALGFALWDRGADPASPQRAVGR